MGTLYAVAVQANTRVWKSGVEPGPKMRSGRGRARALARGEAEPQPVSVKELAIGLPTSAWTQVAWREGSNAMLEFALRVRPASSRDKAGALAPHEWLPIERLGGEKQLTKYWLSTLREDTALAVLADTAKLRWPIERDYKELKSELGLAHFEGRGWRGFHHHATLCIAAYGFLIRERAAFPPEEPRDAKSLPFPRSKTARPPRSEPRGTFPTR